jgi:hypothetical protein
MVFMMGPQLKLTGLSVIGMSTELLTTQFPANTVKKGNLLQPVFDVVH